MAKNSKKNVQCRRNQIMELLAEKGGASVDEIAHCLGVSSMTTRRDIMALESLLFVKREVGGHIRLLERIAVDTALAKRQASNTTAKAAIARLAAKLVAEGDTIGLDASTSALHLAGMLAGHTHLRVITNNYSVLSVLPPKEKVEMICTGGILRPKSMSMAGPIACETIDRFVYDKVFLSCNAVDALVGVTNSESDEIQTKLAFIRNAKQNILLADHTKLGKIAYQKCCPIQKIHILITDCEEEDTLAPFRAQGVEVLSAAAL